MQAPMGLIHRRPWLCALFGLWLTMSGLALMVPPAGAADLTLGKLAGWDVPGLGPLPLTRVATFGDYTSGTLTLKGMSFTAVLFRGAGQAKFNVGLLSGDTFKPLKLLAALEGEVLAGLQRELPDWPRLKSALDSGPLADLELIKPGFILVPSENAGRGIKLPRPLADQVGVPTADLVQGVNLMSRASVLGDAAGLLQKTGLASSNLALTGGYDTAAKARPGATAVDALSLKVRLGALAPEDAPSHLAFGEAVLWMKGQSGRMATGLTTSVTATLTPGGSLKLDPVTVTRDPLQQEVRITAHSGAPGASFLRLPVADAAITQVDFLGVIDAQGRRKARYSLQGQYRVAGSAPRDFTALLLPGKPPQYEVTIYTETSLAQLTDWKMPGLDALKFQKVTFGNGYIVGDMTLQSIPFSGALFKGPGQSKYNAALAADATFDLSALRGDLKGTPLADLDLARPLFLLVPPENAGTGLKLHERVAAHLDREAAERTYDLKYGINLITRAQVKGLPGGLLAGVGLSPSSVLLTGLLDAAILSGGGAPLSEAMVNATSLQALLPAAAQRKPFLSFGGSTLWVKGVSGKFATGLATSVSVNVGRGVRFDPVTVTRDPVNRLVTIEGGSPSRTDFLSLPLGGAAIKQVAFHGLIDEKQKDKDEYTLKGQYSLGNSAPRDFTAVLTGGTPAQYEVTLQGDTNLALLTGWQEPALQSVALRDVVLGNDYALGNATIRSMPFTGIVFKSAGQAKSSVAFLSGDTLGLPKMLKALEGTPLAELELTHPGFVLIPKENAGAVKLPTVVATHVRLPPEELKPGLNLLANGKAYGDLAALLTRLGVDPNSIPVVGTLDPVILAGAEQVAQPFLDKLDLRIPIHNLKLPGALKAVSAHDGYLALRGVQKGIDASVAAQLTVDAGSSGRAVFDASLRLVKAASGNSLQVTGGHPGEWSRAFGIPWLKVRNVKLDGVLGTPNSLQILGTMDFPSVKNLTVSVDLSKMEGATDVVVRVTGAEVSPGEIPGLTAIPHIGDFRFRDLLLSADAVGATVRHTTLSWLKDVQAVAFEVNGRWSLAALLGDIDLSRLMAVPPFARPVLGKLRLHQAALLLAQADLKGRVGSLPRAAQDRLADIYGGPDAVVQAASGVNLVSRFDPSSMGGAGSRLVPPGQRAVVQGAAGGVVGGGQPSLALCGPVPPVALPGSLAFLSLPPGAQTSFCIRLSQEVASAGVELSGVMGVKLNKHTVDFDTRIELGVDSQGGLVAAVQGKSLNSWRDAMAIHGLSLDPGTTLEVKAAGTSEVTVKFLGKTHIGSRLADVAGSASVLGGVVEKGAFRVKLSELTLSDLVALSNEAVKAGGGQPVKVDFPDAKLRNVDIGFASPGASMPELGLPNGGSRVAGDLWFLLKDRSLARAWADMSPTGMVMVGDVADFALGPVALKGNKVDIRTQTTPTQPPHFKIVGGMTIMGKQISGEIEAGPEDMSVVSALNLGGLLDLDLHAGMETPLTGLDAAALASQDLSLNAHLKSDLGGWVRTEGKKAVDKVFNGLGGQMKKLVADVEMAEKEVNRLNGLLDKAKERARAGAKTVDQQIAQAQRKVDDLAGRVNSIKRDIDREKGAIHGCNYQMSICYWWNWRGRCTKHKDVPDVRRDAECAADNARHAAAVVGLEATLKSTEAAKAAAEGVLAGIRKGEKGVDIASLDPEVLALEAALLTAHVALEAAKKASTGAELGLGQLTAGLNALDRVDVLKMKEATITGSLRKAVSGEPVVLGLDFDAAGKAQHLRLAFSLKDQAYNAKQLETLALLVAKASVESLPNVGPAVTHLLNDAFVGLHDAADKELAKAIKANGLE